MDAQPSMAPLVHLLTQVLEALEDDISLEEARRRAARAAETFRDRLDAQGRELSDALADALPDSQTVLTHSASNSVRSGLLKARKGIKVICLESRPQNEGHGLARTLAQAGIPVTLAVDAAAESLVPRADLVLLGADSVGDRGVVNKIGSAAVARSAQAHGVPVWVAADATKWMPPGFPQFVADDRPADEIWRGARGVRVWNRYFECLNFELMDRLVCGSGVLSRAELDDRRAELRAAPALLAWADRKSVELERRG
jgi:translation initiation factor 2B subunit (eIF-2B alpha/beta/delta family)